MAGKKPNIENLMTLTFLKSTAVDFIRANILVPFYNILSTDERIGEFAQKYR
jgi:hypothetical protein